MDAIALIGLIKLVLPSRTIRLCDGGFIEYNSEIYRDADDVFGSLGAIEKLTEGTGDTVPAVVMVLQPPSSSAIADLSQPGNQTARVTFSIAEFNVNTGLIVSGNDVFVGQIDQTVIKIGRDRRDVTVSVVSLAERLFDGNIGNSLTSTFHKSVWGSSELGEDNATGLSDKIYWGVDQPTRYAAATSPTGIWNF